MSTPTAPGFGASVAAVYRLQLKRTIRGRKLRLGVISAALVLFTVVLSRYLGDDVSAEIAVGKSIEWGFFSLLCFLVPFLFASGSIAEEVEGRTFVYLAARPVGRPAITFGKYLAAVVLSVGVLGASLLLLHVASYATEPSAMIDELGSTLRALGAITLLTLYYCAICVFWGSLVPEAAGIIATLHMAVLEFVFGILPGFMRLVSMNYMSQQIAGLEKGGLLAEYVPDLSVPVMCGAVGAATLFFLAMGILTVSISEFRFSKA